MCILFFSQIVFENTFFYYKNKEISGILKLKSCIFIWWEVRVYTLPSAFRLQLESVSSKNHLVLVVWSSFFIYLVYHNHIYTYTAEMLIHVHENIIFTGKYGWSTFDNGVSLVMSMYQPKL
jgi:hypothetical protein